MGDLRSYVERLLRSPQNRGILVVQVVGAEPFIQFSGGANGVEMDFPLITPAQRGREERIRHFFNTRHLHVRATFDSDGSPFIDVDLPADAGIVTGITEAVFAEIFGVRDPVQLEFAGEGLGVAA